MRHLTTVVFSLLFAYFIVFFVVPEKRPIVQSDAEVCESAPENPEFSRMPSETIHDMMRFHLQPSGQPPLNFSDPFLHSKVSWPAHKPVLVPAVYDEYDQNIPSWLLRWPVWIYQRRFEDLPLFCPNYGHEGGVYLKFIVDFYDNLPEKIAFIQASPTWHFYGWEGIVRCLKPEINFTTLAPV